MTPSQVQPASAATIRVVQSDLWRTHGSHLQTVTSGRSDGCGATPEERSDYPFGHVTSTSLMTRSNRSSSRTFMFPVLRKQCDPIQPSVKYSSKLGLKNSCSRATSTNPSRPSSLVQTVVTPSLLASRRGAKSRFTVSGEIDGHHTVSLREERHLGIPIGSITTPAMHEYQRRLATAVDFVADGHAVSRKD